MSGQSATTSGFPATLWTLVVEAGAQDRAAARDALGQLLSRYIPALVRYVSKRWPSLRQDAEDLVHGFVSEKMLERNLLAAPDRTKGKFRTFLLTCLQNYIFSELRRKRPKDAPLEPGDAALPVRDGHDRVFEVEWARQVIARAIERTRRECEEDGRLAEFELFRERVLKPTLESETPEDYGRLVDRLQLESPQQASNLVVTGKRHFERCLRDVIREYCRSEAEVDEEIQDLRRILSRA